VNSPFSFSALDTLGLTLEAMQSHGFSAQHFQKIESGKKAVNLYTAYRICKAFKMSLSELFGGL
jgi:DNA-binding XRE family transcriptional regulator